MGSIGKAIKESVQLWLILATYTWALEFQAVISLYQEPLYDRVLDCAAVLLTVAFWAALLSLTLVGLAIVLRVSDPAVVNRLICKYTFIVVTGYHFARWLHTWPLLDRYPPLLTFILFSACLGLGFWVVIHRRQGQPIPLKLSNLPGFSDLFWFGAVPILVSATILVGSRVMTFTVYGRGPLASAALPRAAGPGDHSKPNVILIVLDGLRAQSMSLYGYHRETTPSINEFATRSTVFTQANSNATMTQVSITTLLTGKHPFTHGRLTRYQPRYKSSENLLALLKKRGYANYAIVSNWEASLHPLGFSPWLSQDEISNFKLESLHSLNKYGIRNTSTGLSLYKGLLGVFRVFGFAESDYWLAVFQKTAGRGPTAAYGTARSTLQWARSLLLTANSPFFLFIHLNEPHDPYFAPPPFRGKFFSADDRSLREKSPEPVIYAPYAAEAQPVIDTYRNEYDEAISYADVELGKFLKDIEEIKNTLVIITSDHGESFERGYFGHGRELFESSTHVPLIIRSPGQEKGKRLNDRVQTIDIAPTILESLQISIPSWVDGKPVGQRQNEPSSTFAVNFEHSDGKTIHNLPTKLAIWRGAHKAIFSCDTKLAELYDLSTDPDENIDLSPHLPALLDDLRHSLRAFLETGAGRELLPCVESISN